MIPIILLQSDWILWQHIMWSTYPSTAEPFVVQEALFAIHRPEQDVDRVCCLLVDGDMWFGGWDDDDDRVILLDVGYTSSQIPLIYQLKWMSTLDQPVVSQNSI